MKPKSTSSLALAFLLSSTLALSPELPAAPQTAGQRAGEVSRVIPAVTIGRGAKTIPASAKSEVLWQDQLNTQASARARVGLDDGSVLNVGSDSSMRVIKHDATTQQTDLELTYGKLRTQAQKISKPDGKFEVHTPAGVAGVVGTDFYTEYANNVMNVVVFEGFVRVCNLGGQCVVVKAGQMTSVRTGDNSAPPAPTQATLSTLTTATTDTDNGGVSSLGLVAATAPHISKLTAVMIAVIAAVPAVVVPVAVSHGKGKQAPVAPVNPCILNPRLPQCG
jgi:ferric-dicitrate binding protein FerR (iron transport regulator)